MRMKNVMRLLAGILSVAMFFSTNSFGVLAAGIDAVSEENTVSVESNGDESDTNCVEEGENVQTSSEYCADASEMSKEDEEEKTEEISFEGSDSEENCSEDNDSASEEKVSEEDFEEDYSMEDFEDDFSETDEDNESSEESDIEENVENAEDIDDEISVEEGMESITYTSNNVSWEIDSKGKLIISGSGNWERSNSYYAPWNDYRDKIKSAEVNLKDVTNLSYMFYECNNLENVNLKNLDTSNVKYTQKLFYNCKKLATLDLSNFNTSYVVNMSGMFNGCAMLDSLDLGNFDTSQVTDMSYMFYYCEKLENLDLSNFNTSKVTDMSGMFGGCYALYWVNLNYFDTSKVTNMDEMFYFCSELSSLVLSSFIINQNVSADSFFSGCSSLREIVTPQDCQSTIKFPSGTWKTLEGKKCTEFPSTTVFMIKGNALPFEHSVIVYVLNGGQNNRENPLSHGGYGKIELKDPSKTGYLFEGWYDSADFSGNKVTEVSGEYTVVYAKWSPIKYTITLVGNGGKYTDNNQKTSESRKVQMEYDGNNLKLNTLGFSRTGYALKGWNTSEDGTGQAYSLNTTVKNLTTKNNDNITLYAQWQAYVYYISFNINIPTFSGVYSGKMNRITLSYDESINLPENKFIREGYSFKGWATEENSSKVVYKDKEKVKNLTTEKEKAIYLYAVWSINTYNVKYNLNGSKGTVPKTVKNLQYDINKIKIASLPNNASLAKMGSGYVFKGWNTKADGSGDTFIPFELTNIDVEKDNTTITLYAIWEYKYIISDNLSEETKKKMVSHYNVSQTASKIVEELGLNYDTESPENYRNPGYYVAGFNTSQAKALKGKIKYKLSSKIKNVPGKTLYAVWKPIKYTVKFDKNAPEGMKVKGKMSNISATYGKIFTLKANAYKCSGYVFKGWSTEADSQEIIFTNKQKITENMTINNKEVITLYAVWEKQN